MKTANKSMAIEYEVFKKAPIKEALIDINIERSDRLSINSITQLYSKLKDRFPITEKRIRRSSQFELNQSRQLEVLDHREELKGYRFISDDNKKAVQYRLDGFTFNLLEPYSKWDHFKAEAKELWDLYTEIIPENTIIQRIGLRYINRLEVPLTNNLKEYIKTLPEIATEIPYTYSNFLMRIGFYDEKTNTKAILTEMIDEQEDTPDIIPIIFDIDAFYECQIDYKHIEIWDILEDLRVFKNEIFHKSITEKTKELIR